MALLLSRKFCFWSERYLHSCGTRRRPLDCGEWGANIKHPDEWESIHSVITGHKDREEATPFIVFGKLSKWESSVRKQMFNVCELSQESFLLPNLRLCSLTCEMYSTRQWCCSTHRDEGKLQLEKELRDLWGWLSILQFHIIFWLIKSLLFKSTLFCQPTAPIVSPTAFLSPFFVLLWPYTPPNTSVSLPSAGPLLTAPVLRGEGEPSFPDSSKFVYPFRFFWWKTPISLEGHSKIFISPSVPVITVNLSTVRSVL